MTTNSQSWVRSNPGASSRCPLWQSPKHLIPHLFFWAITKELDPKWSSQDMNHAIQDASVTDSNFTHCAVPNVANMFDQSQMCFQSHNSCQSKGYKFVIGEESGLSYKKSSVQILVLLGVHPRSGSRDTHCTTQVEQIHVVSI